MLKKLILENFRNHKNYELDFDQVTVLIGQNGIGKTNILESIMLLSFCRSFREDDKKSLIFNESDYSRIIGDDLELFLGRFPRFVMVAKERGIKRKLSEFIGILPSVIFSPETMSIITGSPGERRRFLDMMISQANKEYLENLIAYKKVRTQRNNLLQLIARGNAREEELDFWDQELSKSGEAIIKTRKEAIEFFNLEISELYQEISGQKNDKLEIVFVNNFEGELLSKLRSNRGREIAFGGTLFGPHRDDLVFKLNNMDADKFASRGETKSAVLALKVCELKYLEHKRKENKERYKIVTPLILLDDVFSEFDQNRRAHLSKLITNYQALITATEREHLSPELLKIAKIVELR